MVKYGLCDGYTPVAVKQLNELSSQAEFYAEAVNMRKLRHPKLVSLNKQQHLNELIYNPDAACRNSE